MNSPPPHAPVDWDARRAEFAKAVHAYADAAESSASSYAVASVLDPEDRRKRELAVEAITRHQALKAMAKHVVDLMNISFPLHQLRPVASPRPPEDGAPTRPEAGT